MQQLIANWKGMSLVSRLVMVVLAVAVLAFGAITLFDIPVFPAQSNQESSNDEEQQDGGSTSEQDVSLELTESQKAAIDSYDAEEEEIVARLQNGLWSTLDEKTVITFSAKTFTVSTSGNSGTPRPYAILSHTNLTENPYESNFSVNTVAAIETDEGVSILNLQRITQGTTSSYAIDWPGVVNGTLLQVSLARTVRIDGDISALNQLLGKETVEGIVSEVQTQAVEYYPTAGVATWSGKADVDWNEGILRTSFTLNNAEKTTIEIERALSSDSGRS